MFDGELKVQMDSFECLGVMHEQCPKTLEIWTHQQHYVKQLKPINVDAYVMSDLQAEVSDQTKQSFQSLLGGVAWMTQTCIAICIYVAYLQRKGKGTDGERRPFPQPPPKLDQENGHEAWNSIEKACGGHQAYGNH